jgi:hypothetical protein
VKSTRTGLDLKNISAGNKKQIWNLEFGIPDLGFVSLMSSQSHSAINK